MAKITPQRLKKAAAPRPWDIGNRTLYDLCKKHPKHTDEQEIIAKFWLIGRAYAAAIERRKEKGIHSGNDFYTKKVAPRIKKAGIDKTLEPLKSFKRINDKNADKIIEIHRKLTELLSDDSFTGLEKRSLASKYLHFHFPNLYFIYDSRAKKAIGKILTRSETPKTLIKKEHDTEYKKFVEKCLYLRSKIESRPDIKSPFTPRHLDNLLLDIAAAEAKNRGS
jgi:hypothetical protein